VLRPSIGNLIIVTAMAVLGIYALKAISRTVAVPGLRDVVDAI
jgi:hypothetical protein